MKKNYCYYCDNENTHEGHEFKYISDEKVHISVMCDKCYEDEKGADEIE